MNSEEIRDNAVYDEKKEEWHCKNCNSVILEKRQIVSLHMKGMGGGFGETYINIIPYCPKCEGEPPSFGFDYYGSKTDPETKEMKIIRTTMEQAGY